MLTVSDTASVESSQSGVSPGSHHRDPHWQRPSPDHHQPPTTVSPQCNGAAGDAAGTTDYLLQRVTDEDVTMEDGASVEYVFVTISYHISNWHIWILSYK